MRIFLLLITLFHCSSFAYDSECGIDGEFIESLSSSYTPDLRNKRNSAKQEAKPTLIVFISSSMPIASLKKYSLEAKNYNNIVFLMRGLVKSSFMNTKDFVLSFDGGIQIEEQAFNTYNVSVVPTIVLAKEDKNGEVVFDKVSGNISISSALEIFAQGGDMNLEASEILRNMEK